jgi:hypothetical protein
MPCKHHTALSECRALVFDIGPSRPSRTLEIAVK